MEMVWKTRPTASGITADGTGGNNAREKLSWHAFQQNNVDTVSVLAYLSTFFEGQILKSMIVWPFCTRERHSLRLTLIHSVHTDGKRKNFLQIATKIASHSIVMALEQRMHMHTHTLKRAVIWSTLRSAYTACVACAYLSIQMLAGMSAGIWKYGNFAVCTVHLHHRQ